MEELPVLEIKKEPSLLVSIKVEKEEPEETQEGLSEFDLNFSYDTKKEPEISSNVFIKEEVIISDSIKQEEFLTAKVDDDFSDEKELIVDEFKDEEIKNLEIHKENITLEIEKKFSCNLCGKTFAWAKEVRKHKLRSHICFKCKLCQKRFVDLTSLKHHKRERHKIVYVYNCESCDQAFFTVKDLLKHMKEHKLENTLECSKCLKKIKDETDMLKHKCIPSNKQFICDICKKYFASESRVGIHKRKFHLVEIITSEKEKERPSVENKEYQCKICKKSYKNSNSLSNHMRKTHKKNDEIKDIYQCEICNKSCIQPSQLKAHQLIHRGVECFNLGRMKY